MENNMLVFVLIGIAILLFLIWFLRKNRKDQKDMERTIKASELHPEKHKDEQV